MSFNKEALVLFFSSIALSFGIFLLWIIIWAAEKDGLHPDKEVVSWISLVILAYSTYLSYLGFRALIDRDNI